jgi:hypothetical protein
MHVNFCDVDSLLPFRCLAPGGMNSSLSLSLSLPTSPPDRLPRRLRYSKKLLRRKAVLRVPCIFSVTLIIVRLDQLRTTQIDDYLTDILHFGSVCAPPIVVAVEVRLLI